MSNLFSEGSFFFIFAALIAISFGEFGLLFLAPNVYYRFGLPVYFRTKDVRLLNRSTTLQQILNLLLDGQNQLRDTSTSAIMPSKMVTRLLDENSLGVRRLSTGRRRNSPMTTALITLNPGEGRLNFRLQLRWSSLIIFPFLFFAFSTVNGIPSGFNEIPSGFTVFYVFFLLIIVIFSFSAYREIKMMLEYWHEIEAKLNK